MTDRILFHRFSEAFPLMDGEPFDQLVADIRDNGQREPVRTYRGEVLDGRNRFLACEHLGVDPWIVESDAETDDEALAESISCNLHRRHLTASQRAMVGAMLEPMFAELAKARQVAAGSNFGRGKVSANLREPNVKAAEDAAEAVNVSPRSINHAKAVTELGTPELRAAVVAGDIAVSAASTAAAWEPEEQRDFVERVEAGEKPSAVIKAHVSHNSGNNEWYTPPEFIAAAREAMGGIDCDPATSEIANATVQAPTFYTEKTDGLSQAWHGNVWMNPPYANPLIRHFCEAVTDRYAAGEIGAACVLVNNATETRWFQYMLNEAAAVCFPRSRVKFLDPNGDATGAPLQGQAIVYLGTDVDAFRAAFEPIGAVLYAFR
jgi:ParB family chromosome partitioning protein